ncbi:MAG: hypothetical protein HC899_37560 [Leptolyngbyaceae cyanobacterium SM1_4_3]|nr:hypothetical protein [Leptolyngbyaceae cyanobacterium SM1_4_3]
MAVEFAIVELIGAFLQLFGDQLYNTLLLRPSPDTRCFKGNNPLAVFGTELHRHHARLITIVEIFVLLNNVSRGGAISYHFVDHCGKGIESSRFKVGSNAALEVLEERARGLRVERQVGDADLLEEGPGAVAGGVDGNRTTAKPSPPIAASSRSRPSFLHMRG